MGRALRARESAANGERAVGARAAWRGASVRSAYGGAGAEAPQTYGVVGSGLPAKIKPGVLGVERSPAPAWLASLQKRVLCFFPSKFAWVLISLPGED